MSNLQRFVENYTVSADEFKRLPINESVLSKTIESNDGKSYKAKAVYTFPISRPDKENLNGRIYTSKLWEKVIKEKQADGCFGLMDHPEDDGSTKNAWCVWRDLRFSEDKKLVVADAYLFGFWGQQVLEALEAGGSIGLSTSGWGEFKEDDKTLNEETFTLERVADHVLNPSYSVFGHQEDLVASKESAEKKDEGYNVADHSAEIASNLRVDNRNYIVYVAKLNSDIKFYGKFTDQTFGEFDSPVNKYFDRSKTISFTIPANKPFVIVEKPTKDGAYITVYPDSWYYVNLSDYEKLMENISIIRNESIDNLENSPKLKEIIMENTTANVSPSIEEKSLLLNLKSMFKETKAIENTFERIESCNSLLSYFTESLDHVGADLKNDIQNLIKEDNEFIHKCVESYKDLNDKATSFEAKANELEASLKEANEKLETNEAALKEANEKIDVISKENADLNEKYNQSCDLLDSFKIYSQKQKEITKTLEAEKNGMVTPTQYKESLVYSQSLEEEIKNLKEQLHEAKKAKKEDDDVKSNNKTNDDDSKNDDDLKKVDDEKKESFISKDVEMYYEDLEDMNPQVSRIKEDIMKCKTLLEAQMTYLRLKGLCGETDQSYYEASARNASRTLSKQEASNYQRKSILREGWL